MYANPGTYKAIVTVDDGRPGIGGVSSSFMWVSVTPTPTSTPTSTLNLPPVINSFTGPSSVIAGTNNTWQAQATDPNGNPVTYAFLWGDSGYPGSSTVSGVSGATVSASRTYWTPGTYTQTLQAWDTPYSGWVQQARSLVVVVASSTSPTPKTIYPTPSTSPKTLTPIAASALDTVQAQLDAIKSQLQYLLMQMR